MFWAVLYDLDMSINYVNVSELLDIMFLKIPVSIYIEISKRFSSD